MMESLTLLWQTTGIAHLTWGTVAMLGGGVVLLYWAVVKEFEPVFLVALGFSAILSNIPMAGMADAGGLFYHLYEMGVRSGVFPLLMVLGLGTLVDFGPLLAMPSLFFLGAAAQLGIFVTLAVGLASNVLPGLHFSLTDAAAIGMIGGANGPMVILLASRLAPDLLGAIAVATYIGMTTLHLLQPPLLRALTTAQERQVTMPALRPVSKWEKLFFPVLLLLLCILLLPSAAPLLGMFAFGNFLKESGVIERVARLSHVKTAQTDLMHVVTLFLGLAVGSRLTAATFFSVETLGIVVLGIMAFAVGTATGVLMGKLLYRKTNGTINPLIGAAGIAVVPLSARVASKLGLEANPHNLLLPHAMGANLAGVISSAVAAGTLLALFGKN